MTVKKRKTTKTTSPVKKRTITKKKKTIATDKKIGNQEVRVIKRIIPLLKFENNTSLYNAILNKDQHELLLAFLKTLFNKGIPIVKAENVYLKKDLETQSDNGKS